MRMAPPRRDGESRLRGRKAMVAAARRAGRSERRVRLQGKPILSVTSIIPMEEVAKANPRAWFAAYQSPNQAAVEGMVERVARAGFDALGLTADVPIGSNRENDARSGFGFPIRPSPKLSFDVLTHPRWMGVLTRTLLRRGVPHIFNREPDGGPGLFSSAVTGIAAHQALSWKDLKLMRERWKGPLVLRACG
jgi:L-lactate dehydrogenase (cytochrome)